MELLMSDLSGSKDDGKHLSLGTDAAVTGSVVNAVLPLLQMADPARVTAVKYALLQLAVLQKEHVSLTMPIMTLSN